MLYRYRKADSQWETLMRFGDSNLQWQPRQIVQLSEEYMAAYYDSNSELYLLTKTDASLLPEQKELTRTSSDTALSCSKDKPISSSP